MLGAAYLGGVCLLPEILRGQFAIPFYFGGTSVLIVVSVTMDTIQQVQSHLLAHQYESLIQKSQLRGKSRSKRRRGQPVNEYHTVGPPGAGKGTQAQFLVESWVWFSCQRVICFVRQRIVEPKWVSSLLK